MSASTPNPYDGVFATTHWSVVLAAQRDDTTRTFEALSSLCQSYWYPLYAFVRRQGHSAHDAQDLTQAFFAQLLEKKWLSNVDRERGRFRSFLLAAMKHFLANEWDKVQAQKRGAGQRFIALDAASAETRYALEPADNTTPERVFERRWAMTLLDRVLQCLRREHEIAGKTAQFDTLKEALTGDRSALPYAQLGNRLALSEGAVKVAVHRLRQRYRELLREEIANTVAREDDVEEELRHLFAVLRG